MKNLFADFLFFLIALCVFGLYFLAWIQHTHKRLFKVKFTIKANDLVRDARAKMPKYKPLTKAESFERRKEVHTVKDAEWQEVRYYERDSKGQFRRTNLNDTDK